MADEKVIELRNVWVTYNDVPVLEDITLTVGEKDFLAILGPNGSGKTTLLRVILGLVRPVRGEVRIFGKSPREGRGLIGYLPQQAAFDSDFPISVSEVVLMGRYKGLLRGYSREDRKAAAEALKLVDMDEFATRQVGKLSGGQLQRVFIARAIAKEPRLLLLDEPTASIDPEMQKSFYDLLTELRKKMAVVMVTHDTGVVTDLVDHVACINRRLFYHGPAEVGLENLEAVYACPIELVSHGGVPHRVLGRHKKSD